MYKWEWETYSAEHFERDRQGISLNDFSEGYPEHFFLRIGSCGTIINTYYGKYICFYLYHCYSDIGSWYYKDYLYFGSILREKFGNEDVNAYSIEDIFKGTSSTVDKLRGVEVFAIGRFEVTK